MIAILLWGVGVLFVAYQFFLQTSTSIIIPQLMQDFSLNAAGIGLISASFFYTYVALQIPAGALADRIGPHRLLTISIALCASACAVFAWAPNFEIATTARALMGVFAAPGFVCTLAIAGRWLPSNRFAFFAGLTEFSAMLGAALTGGVLAYWVIMVGWRKTFLSCAIIGGILAILSMIVVKKGHTHLNRQPVVITAEPSKKPFKTVMFGLLKTKQIWICGIFISSVFAIIQAFASLWCVPFLTQRYGLFTHEAGLATAMIFVGAAIGAPFTGWLSDFIGQRRIIMQIWSGMALVLLIAILYIPHIPWIVMHILLFLFGIYLSVFLLAYAAVRDAVPPDQTGAALGFTNMMCGGLGAPLLQPLIGWLLEYQWDGRMLDNLPYFTSVNYQWALLPLIIALGIAHLATYFIKDYRKNMA